MARLAAFLLLLVCPRSMEDAMCHSSDYYWMAKAKKAEEARAEQQRRAGQIDKMLSEANKQAEESKDPAAAKDVAPAK